MSKTKNLKTISALLSIFPVIAMASCAELGKMAAEGMTEKTNSLKGIACSFSYINNLYTPKTNTTSVGIMGKGWTEGSNAVTVVMYKKHGVGLYKVDGNVTVDNDPIPYIMAGSYTKIFDTEDLKPKTVKVTSSSGDEATVTIDPPKPVNLISVNGEKDGADVDLNSDLNLEFGDFPGLTKDDRIKVSFLMDVLGVKEFVDIGVFKPAKRIRIPAAAFKNLSVNASASGVAELKPGKNYIRIERYKVKKERIPPFAASQALSISWSTMPVELKGNSTQNINISVSGNENSLAYNFSKPNAFMAKPFSKAKKFALYSLSVRGLLRDVQTNITTKDNALMGTRTTTTTTITRQFPVLPNAYWDQLMNNSYKDVVKVMKDMNISLIPVEKVTASKEYEFLDDVNDINNQYEVVRKYKNTKSLVPSSLDKLMSSFSSTFANDRPEVRLIDELGVDGLIGVSIDLVIDKNSEQIKLAPRMVIRMIGGSNGYSVGPLTYANGYIYGAGVPFSEAEFSNINALNRITRKDDMMKMLAKGLKSLGQKEKEMGYDDIWALQ